MGTKLGRVQKLTTGKDQLPAIQRNISDQKTPMTLFSLSTVPTITSSWGASSSATISPPWGTVV